MPQPPVLRIAKSGLAWRPNATLSRLSPLQHLLCSQDDLKVCVWDVSLFTRHLKRHFLHLTPWRFALAHALTALLPVLAAPGPASVASQTGAVKPLLFFTPSRSPVPEVVLTHVETLQWSCFVNSLQFTTCAYRALPGLAIKEALSHLMFFASSTQVAQAFN